MWKWTVFRVNLAVILVMILAAGFSHHSYQEKLKQSQAKVEIREMSPSIKGIQSVDQGQAFSLDMPLEKGFEPALGRNFLVYPKISYLPGQLPQDYKLIYRSYDVKKGKLGEEMQLDLLAFLKEKGIQVSSYILLRQEVYVHKGHDVVKIFLGPDQAIYLDLETKELLDKEPQEKIQRLTQEAKDYLNQYSINSPSYSFYDQGLPTLLAKEEGMIFISRTRPLYLAGENMSKEEILHLLESLLDPGEQLTIQKKGEGNE